MKAISGKRLPTDVLDSHTHICDLVNVQYPVVQLFTDGKRNWIYLWCERSVDRTSRWMVFPTSRSRMVEYLKGEATMRTLVLEAQVHWVLETSQPLSLAVIKDDKRRKHRRTVTRVTLDQLTEYLPSDDSYFDEELTSDLDLSKELTPTVYSVAIDGDWFGQDFTFLFKTYERLYAFFYSTQPRFVRTLSQNLERLLRSPWKGGFSRVNLFTSLPRQVPGIHALKVKHIQYASPGEVRFEAISSIGETIRLSTNALIVNEEAITDASKCITKTLTSTGLNTLDLSAVDDSNAPLNPTQRTSIEEACATIASLLGLQTELDTLRKHSPNLVVYSKAVVSLIRQLTKLATLQEQEMLDLTRKT